MSHLKRIAPSATPPRFAATITKLMNEAEEEMREHRDTEYAARLRDMLSALDSAEMRAYDAEAAHPAR
jgi:hypothetical protein